MAESNQVEALLAAAVAPGPGIITDDREIAPPPEPNAAPAAPKADAGVTEPTRELSPEEADIRRLMKEMEAETAAAAPAGTPPAPAATPAATPATPATPAAAAIAAVSGTAPTPGTAPAAAPVTVQPPPDGKLAALRAERESRHKAQQEAAYWRGVAEARGQQNSQPAVPATPEPTPAEQMADLRRKQQALAADFDSAKITAAAWEEQRQALDDQLSDLRFKQHQPAPAPVQPAQPPTDLTLEQHSQQLSVQYPVLNVLQSSDLEPLVALAYAQAQREGKPIQNGTATGTLDLRTRVAKLATVTYADVLAAATAAGQVVAGTAPPAAPATPGGLSPTAAARDATLMAAAGFPPNAAALGTAATSVQPTEAELDARLTHMNPSEADSLLLSMPGLVKKLTGVDIPPQRR